MLKPKMNMELTYKEEVEEDEFVMLFVVVGHEGGWPEEAVGHTGQQEGNHGGPYQATAKGKHPYWEDESKTQRTQPNRQLHWNQTSHIQIVVWPEHMTYVSHIFFRDKVSIDKT